MENSLIVGVELTIGYGGLERALTIRNPEWRGNNGERRFIKSEEYDDFDMDDLDGKSDYRRADDGHTELIFPNGATMRDLGIIGHYPGLGEFTYDMGKGPVKMVCEEYARRGGDLVLAGIRVFGPNNMGSEWGVGSVNLDRLQTALSHREEIANRINELLGYEFGMDDVRLFSTYRSN